jgi:hypothetical protein
MINDQIGWTTRINSIRIASKLGHSISHSSEIHNGWHSGEILQNDSGRAERNLDLALMLLP